MPPAGRPTGLAGQVSVLVPFTLGITAVILLLLPFRPFGGFVPMPIFSLAIIFYWSLGNEKYLPPFAVFSIGLFHDLASGGALGMWALIYLVIQYLVAGQRDYFVGRDWHVIWTGFLIICLLTALLVWGVTSLLAGQWIAMGPALGPCLVTALVFPLLRLMFNEIDRRMIRE